jgi:hypothetical protein
LTASQEIDGIAGSFDAITGNFDAITGSSCHHRKLMPSQEILMGTVHEKKKLEEFFE